MDIIQIGSLSILLKWFLLGVSVISSVVILKILLHSLPKEKPKKEVFDLLTNSIILGFFIWKGSLLLFEPSIILHNPLSVLYFTGGNSGLILAIIFTLSYFIYQARKLKFLFTLKYGLLFILATLFIFYMLSAFFLGDHSIPYLLVSLSSLFAFCLIAFKGIRAKYKQLLATFGLLGMVVWGIHDFAQSEKLKLMGPNQQSGEKKQMIGLEEGNLAPDFQLQSLDGKELKLSDLKGKTVILNFWASWCPPCKAEMPHFQKFYLDHKNENVEIIAINLTTQEDSTTDIEDFVDDYGLTFPILLDSNGILGKTYQAITIPTSYMIDTQGFIRKKIIGPMNTELLEQIVKNVN